MKKWFLDAIEPKGDLKNFHLEISNIAADLGQVLVDPCLYMSGSKYNTPPRRYSAVVKHPPVMQAGGVQFPAQPKKFLQNFFTWKNQNQILSSPVPPPRALSLSLWLADIYWYLVAFVLGETKRGIVVKYPNSSFCAANMEIRVLNWRIRGVKKSEFLWNKCREETILSILADEAKIMRQDTWCWLTITKTSTLTFHLVWWGHPGHVHKDCHQLVDNFAMSKVKI